ncbi:MAG: MYXO-CTERM sorting domain-containing protein [Polyangia bacterium]|jgi:MYXO-CTERM domain-containing protein|nr:MYXO-CTERM sorting domain-containing protein [Polyangia bacterium]
MRSFNIRRLAGPLSFSLLLLASPTAALADDAGVPLPDGGSSNPLDYADEVRSPVSFKYEDLLNDDLCDISIDTGWVPAGSPIQVRFQFELHCGYKVEMDGSAVGSWPPRPGPYLSFRGRPLGGRYEMDYTIDFDLSARVDVTLPGGIVIQEEFDIPYVPDIHMGLYDATRFTPFLLAGNPERPVQVQDDIPYTRLFRVDLLALLAMIMPELQGIDQIVDFWLEVYITGYAGSRLEGRRMVVESDGSSVEHEPPPDLEFTEEGEKKWLPVRTSIKRDYKRVTWEGAVTHYASVSVFPEIKLEALNQTIFSMQLFEIPIPISDQDDYWIVGPESFALELPDLRVPSQMMVGASLIGQQVQSILTIQNIGAGALRGEAFVYPPFFVPYPPRFQVDPDGVVYLPVMFRPAVPGQVEGDLILYSNDPNEHPKVIRLAGIGCESADNCSVPDDAVWVCSIHRECGCSADRASPAGTALATLLLGLLALAWIRRRR